MVVIFWFLVWGSISLDNCKTGSIPRKSYVNESSDCVLQRDAGQVNADSSKIQSGTT